MHLNVFRRPARALLALVSVLALVALGAVTGSASARTSGTDWTVLVGSQTSDMSIMGQRFLPGDITIDAGDSVTWQANSVEPHTVTFYDGGLPQATVPPFDPADATMTMKQGGDSMGAGYFNSGVITTADNAGVIPAPVVHSYTLAFPTTGDFTYYCLVHGIMMRGTVHVQPATTAYPATQADVDADAAFLATAINADGRALMKKVAKDATQHQVFTGADDGIAMVMRFINSRVVIHQGQKVHFLNTQSLGAPHTVTFGTAPVGPAIFNQSGNPKNFRGGNLHSGIMGPGSTFTVTFNKAGTFHYRCLLHKDMGMRGVVVVKP